ncbi:MAG: hypothetical protein ACI9E1_000461 [Cryomorphaceae bacterium]|jgi:hypothetical protein
MKIIFVALLAFVTNIAIAEEKSALLCADQADNRIRLVELLSKNEPNRTLWCYPADDGKAFPLRPTDAKRVEIKGEVHILAAYHGRVKLIRFKDKKIIKDYPAPDSCHSAELLPDGNIVTASSNDETLRVHRSAEDFTDTKLPYAHGVVWDKKAKQIWALGDALYRFNYTDGKLLLAKKYKFPMTPTGHDLFPMRDGKKLLVSNNDALFLFDLKAETFEKISGLREIKSVSEHQDGSIWASDPKDMEKSGSWQSDSVIQIRPEANKRYTNKGAKFYKARWWQKVEFSY